MSDPYITQAPIRLSAIETVVAHGQRYDLTRAEVSTANGWLCVRHYGYTRYIRIRSIDAIESKA